MLTLLKKFYDFMVGDTAEEEYDRWVRDYLRAFPSEPGVKPDPEAEQRLWAHQFLADCRRARAHSPSDASSA